MQFDTQQLRDGLLFAFYIDEPSSYKYLSDISLIRNLGLRKCDFLCSEEASIQMRKSKSKTFLASFQKKFVKNFDFAHD